MKHTFFIITILLSVLFNARADNNESPPILDEEIFTETLSDTEIENLPSITVYKIIGVNATASFTAKYSASENYIYVYERKSGRSIWFYYTIYNNRAYGQENDGRGSFRYVAGDYYFNL